MADRTRHSIDDDLSAVRRKRRGLLGLAAGDVDRVLYALIFVMVLLVISAVGYLVYAVLAPSAAPRTEVERRVMFFEQGVKAQPKIASVWEGYAAALIDAGQYSKASDVIAEGMRKLDDDAGLLVQRARMERERGQYERALKTCDEVIKAVAVFRKKMADEAAAKGSGAPQAASEELVNAEIIRAEIYDEQGKSALAVAAYGRALAESPRMADVLAARGDVHLRAGNDDAARKDFREALRYDPQNAVAIAGLKRLGDTQQ